MKLKDIKNLDIYTVDGLQCGQIDGIYIDKNSRDVCYLGCNAGLFTPDVINGVCDIITLLAPPISQSNLKLENCIVLPVDAAVYDCKGVKLGDDYDYPIISSYKNQRMMTVGEATFDVDKIVSAVGIILINTGRQLPIKKATPKAANAPQTSPAITPSSCNNQDYSFLLGRVTKKSIVDINGNLLIKLGTIITPGVIDYAKQNGKLVELVTVSRS